MTTPSFITTLSVVLIASSALAQSPPSDSPSSSSIEHAAETQEPMNRSNTPDGLGAYIDVGWRATGWAGYPGNGPEASAGVLLLQDHLRLGVTFVARPGPINPQTFDVEPVEGQTYKGQDELTLRSDGNFFGLTIAPRFAMPGASWLEVELPLTIGQAAFGFYLTGEDRETPDGRRVSEWENELLDGRDSSFAIGIEPGLRLQFRTKHDWLRPYVTGAYLFTPGYDAYVVDDYGGLSVAAGVQVFAF